MRSTPVAIALALVALGATVTPSLGQNPIDEFVCDFCQWMVGELEMLLEQGKTEDDAIEFMLEVRKNAPFWATNTYFLHSEISSAHY